MPFQASWIEERLKNAQQENRLAHSYLLVGSDMDALRTLFTRLAANLLSSSKKNHPDLHIIQPESKSRRLTVEQIRNLEQQLQLKAREATIKVAGIIAADRMCIGSAEAANAFLKTLEEPPSNTVIFLLTDRLEQLLPTIRSRCMILQIETANQNSTQEINQPNDMPAWVKHWLMVKGSSADQAYRRAGLLSARWKELREKIEAQAEEKSSADEEILPALIEAEYLLARDNSIRSLIIHAWQHSDRQAAMRIVDGLEGLRYGMSRNIEQNLALEHACLKIADLIEDKF